jgi:hypothetical protein
MFLRLLTALLFCFALAPDALALEYFPEFESLTEDEPESFDGPAGTGSEYPADLLTYMKPESWEYRWLSHPRAFDLSVGSLDATHFLMDQRLKVHARLTGFLEFRFTYFDDRDFEKRSIHHVIELIAWPWERVGFGIYGEPDFFKRRDDTGIALFLRPGSRHEIRFFNTFIDVTRQKRNDRSDTFLEPDLPYSRGLVGRWWSDPEEGKGEFLEYALRHETRTRWLFPDEGYELTYSRIFASVFASRLLSPGLRINARLQADRKREARAPTSASSAIAADNWTTDRLTGFVRAVIPELGPRDDWELTVGVLAAYRWWRADAGNARYQDWLPHFVLGLPGYASGARQDRFGVGFILTDHRSQGPAALFPVGEVPHQTQLRLNLSYEFRFSQTAILKLVVAGDLDEYGSPGSWDGGNGQLSILF